MKMYFIAIVLPGELNKKVLRWKNLMHENYGCKVGLKSPAHITFIPPFWMDQENEKQLLEDVDTISAFAQQFEIATKNFLAFKPRTIFIDVVVNEELRTLKASIDEFFSKNNYKIKIDERPFHPHITVATRDLHKNDFHEAWPSFETREFKTKWRTSGLSVLRHNSKTWDVIYTSVFQNKLNYKSAYRTFHPGTIII
jgi:2'-5' RNA ligase